jgi:hypothetical protein
MSESEAWITQSVAAELREMSLAAINMLVKRGRIRSKAVYGKMLVSRADVLAYQPLTRNKFSKPPTKEVKTPKKSAAKNTKQAKVKKDTPK